MPSSAKASNKSPGPSTAVVTRATDPTEQKLLTKFAVKYQVDERKIFDTMKATAFQQRGKWNKATNSRDPAPEVSDAQMIGLLIVADQYGLNPFTREIYAFPNDTGGIVPIISIDGWIRIVNERAELDSIEFETAPPGTDDPWIICTITRKDRSKPLSITEYLSECARDTDPWKSHPRRMLRHKAFIQCARVAFGFAGVFDPDEGDRIVSIVERRHESLPKSGGFKAGTREPQTVDEALAWSTDQVQAINDKLHAEGVADSLLCATLEVGRIGDLPNTDFDRVMRTIDEIANA